MEELLKNTARSIWSTGNMICHHVCLHMCMLQHGKLQGGGDWHNELVKKLVERGKGKMLGIQSE